MEKQFKDITAKLSSSKPSTVASGLSSVLKYAETASKVLGAIGGAYKGISAIVEVAKFLSGDTEDPTEKLIKQEFEIVFGELNQIKFKLDEIIEEIKESTIETLLLDYLGKMGAGMVKLDTQIKQGTEEADLKHYYSSPEYSDNIITLLRLVTGETRNKYKWAEMIYNRRIKGICKYY